VRAAVLVAAAALAAVRPAAGGVVVEQIEAYEGATGYAAVDFGGAATVTPATGAFAGITFHGDPSVGLINTSSGHAELVGTLFYGSSGPALGAVSDVYATEADAFLSNVVNVQPTTGVAAAPGTFAGGALVINNSYVGDFGSASMDLDSQRRIDFMIAGSDVTFVASAATGITMTNNSPDVDPVVWSSYNALAVSGAQSFNASLSPGKPHADLSMPGVEASFATGYVSGCAAALINQGQSAEQADAARGTVVRSLLMAGADKTDYTRTTANNLDPTNGAGQPDYDASVAILEGGEKPLTTVVGGSAAGTPSTTQKGWTSGTVTASGQSVVLFSAANTLTGLQASLNWDVTSNAPAAGEIDTSNAGEIFPDLTLEVRPVTFSGGQYVLGAAEGDATLHSAATGDNVQYLYYTSTLPAGTYAFLIDGDASLSTRVGFSYELNGTFATQYAADVSGSWGTPGLWTNGIANGPGAVATFPTGVAAATVTLDGDRRVGQLTLSGGAYTIAAGTGGTLTIDDTGDSTGTAAPAVNVLAGTHSITAPVSLVDGVTVTVATGSGLTLRNAVAGSGGLVKAGAGSLVLAGANTYAGATAINGGKVVVTGSLSASSAVTVASGGTLAGTGTVAGTVGLSSGGTITAGSGPTAGDTIGVLTTGTQTWLAGGSYAVKLDPTTSTSDELVLGGLDPGSTGLTVNPVILASGSFAAGLHTFVIADDTASTTAFDSLLASNAIAIGTAPAGTTDQLTTMADGNGGEDLLLELTVATPEPTAATLLGLAVLPLALSRRGRIVGPRQTL
jgi:autotransporter-associated beta strand protein